MPRWEYIDVIEDVGFAIELSRKGADGWRVYLVDKLEDGRRRALLERMVLNAVGL